MKARELNLFSIGVPMTAFTPSHRRDRETGPQESGLDSILPRVHTQGFVHEYPNENRDTITENRDTVIE